MVPRLYPTAKTGAGKSANVALVSLLRAQEQDVQMRRRILRHGMSGIQLPDPCFKLLRGEKRSSHAEQQENCQAAERYAPETTGAARVRTNRAERSWNHIHVAKEKMRCCQKTRRGKTPSSVSTA